MENTIIEATAGALAYEAIKDNRKNKKDVVTCASCDQPVVKKGAFYCVEHTVKEAMAEGEDVRKSTFRKFMDMYGKKEAEVKEKYNTIKEETTMESIKEKTKVTAKDITEGVVATGGTAWDSIKKGSARLMGFAKKHALKSVFGLVTMTVAGTFTTGVVAATLVGAGMYAAVAAAIAVIKARKEKAEINRTELVLGALGQGALYGAIGAGVMYHLFFYAVMGLQAAFYYSAVTFIYSQYFILA